MATNARKHVIPAGTDTTVSRETIFETFANSVHDVVPVATTTERDLLVAALTDAGQAPSSSNPLYVNRANAAGLHRTEYTVDGSTWLPLSAVLKFDSVATRNTWTTSNSSLLQVGDESVVGFVKYEWDGSAWAVKPKSLNADPATFTQHGRGNIVTDANGLFNCSFSPSFPSSCDRVIGIMVGSSYSSGGPGMSVTGFTKDFWSGRIAGVTAPTAFTVDYIAFGR